LDTYSKFKKAYYAGKGSDLQPWGNQNDKRLGELEKLEEHYHSLRGIGRQARVWSKDKNAQRPRGAFWCSAAGHLNLHDHVKDTELQGFGGILLIPKFGVLRLAELIIRPDHRHLTMFRVEMCSPALAGAAAGARVVAELILFLSETSCKNRKFIQTLQGFASRLASEFEIMSGSKNGLRAAKRVFWENCLRLGIARASQIGYLKQ